MTPLVKCVFLVSQMSCQARHLYTVMRDLCGECKTFLSFQFMYLHVVDFEALTYVTTRVDSSVFRACL